MATLRDIQRRIRSVQSTQKITRAMKLVAAAKLRRAQERILAARPYASKMKEMLGNLVVAADGAAHPLLEQREGPRRQVVIIFAGTQGLLDDLPVDTVRDYETFFYGWLERKKPEILAEIRDKREISDALRETLTKAVADAKAEFAAAKGIKAA